MSRWVCGAVALGWILGCAGGAATAPAAPAVAPVSAYPPGPVARQEPAGPLVELKLLELVPDGDRCALVFRKVGAERSNDEDAVGAFDGACPRAASLTWHGDRVVLSSEGRIEELGRGPIPLPPLLYGDTVGVAVFDDAGTLHACGRTNTPVTREANEAVARVDGRLVREGIPAIADGFEVAVRWIRRDSGWERIGEALVYRIILDGPDSTDPCVTAPGFPIDGHRADSEPIDDQYTWEEAPASELPLLDAIGIGGQDWRWDTSRTLADRGDSYDRFRIWAGGRWTDPETLGWQVGWWRFEDHVAVLTANGPVEVFSRRDGRRVYVSGPNTTVIPWPSELPDPRR